MKRIGAAALSLLLAAQLNACGAVISGETPAASAAVNNVDIPSPSSDPSAQEIQPDTLQKLYIDYPQTAGCREAAAFIRESEPVSKDIKACIDEKMASFEEECTLTDLWYDKEKSEALVDSYMKYGRGASNGVTRENVIVILSTLKTGANTWSFEPNAIYTDWKWILIRDNPHSNWVVDDYGN